MSGACDVKLDHHTAVLSLRARYARCRQVLLTVKAGEEALDALDTLQNLLESTTPSVLGLESVQSLVAFVLEGLAKTRLNGLYHQAVLVYFYSLGIEAKGRLSDRLFEKF
jgi:hypothetical protein